MASNDTTAPTAEELKAKDNETFSKMRGVDCFEGLQGQRAAISFTGGKDCHLALQRALDAGLKVVCGAMFFAPNTTFNAHRMEWQRIQGQAIHIPIVDCCLTELATTNDPNDYKAAYAGAIRTLQKEHDIQYIITGDIDYVFTSTTNFMQQVCNNTEQQQQYDCSGVQVLLPLWQQPRKRLLHEMLFKFNFDIRLCCVKTPHFDETWIGRRLDEEAMLEMETKVKDGLDLTGEVGAVVAHSMPCRY